MQTVHYEPYERPHPWGDRPDDLPIAAAVWDKAKAPGSETSSFVIRALFEAVKQLESAAR